MEAKHPKKPDIKAALEQQTKVAEERLNQLKYLQADFDNYRKHFEKEKEEIRKLASESLIKELLTILDDFDGALKSDQNNKGLRLLYEKLIKILGTAGLQPIVSLGKHFDPHYHEALMREASKKEEGIILEELQRGFVLSGKVIRPSRVKISGGSDNNG